jgi:hypothetical protein
MSSKPPGDQLEVYAIQRGPSGRKRHRLNMLRAGIASINASGSPVLDV